MKSMTGYGSAEGPVGGGRVFVEVKSVNHRYCDILLKIPPKMNPFDSHFRKIIKDNVERGKIELYLKEKRGIAETRDLVLDIPLAKKYDQCLKKLERALGFSGRHLHILEVIDAKELISVEEVEVDYEKYWGPIMKIASAALFKLDKMRVSEGRFLLKDQRARLKKIHGLVERIASQSKECLKEQQMKAESRFKQAVNANAIPRERMDAEVSSTIDRLDITEEITRLKSHIVQYSNILNTNDAVGRQLDFLLQEMNREINTIGSKSSDARISNCVISTKTELEKLREQVQNVE